MKKFFEIFAGFVSVLLIFAGCNSGSGTSGSSAAANKKDTVIIKLMAFNPTPITVNKGDTIVWINQDIVAHDVSHYPDRSWHSDTLQPNDVFQKVIEDSSTYFCSIHPTMIGKFDIKR